MIDSNVHLAGRGTSHAGSPWVAGGGEMGGLVRSLDWSKTALGPLQDWPQSLRTSVSSCLSSRFPVLIWWGPELVMIYNDALSMVIGSKHPRALGQRGAEGCWEVWPLLGPALHSVRDKGASIWSENQRLDIERSFESGDLEETYFTFFCSPIRDESDGIGGVFCVVTESTAQVLSERRLRTLSALAQQSAEVTTVAEACLRLASALEANSADLPAAFLYLAGGEDGQGGDIRLAATVGVLRPGGLPIRTTGDEWPLEAVLQTGQPLLVDESGVRCALKALGGQVLIPPKSALLLPFGVLGKPHASGVLVVALAPLLLLDDRYHSFLALVAGHIGTAIASARALQAAQGRAETLAQLDGAKAAFFSKLSREFRTPLTLMLGPTEDALASEGKALTGADLETVHRNGLRLLRLVDTLLDFSRIEAGRAAASFEATDLSALTEDFASAFRLAIERAGLRFELDCEPSGQRVHVDREMWEKIVLNLLSNALKFTFEGAISVGLQIHSGLAILTVRDSGVGIAPEELPRLFERFHRIQGTRSRSYEGAGIGLALARDLVRLHGGDIGVESLEGKGSTFTVTLPVGSGHLLADRIRAPKAQQENAVRDHSFVTEAMGWLPSPARTNRPLAVQAKADPAGPGAGPRILLVDDNADMRDHVARLLRQHWRVDTAADGMQALALAGRAVPSLVLTDVMMPKLDGFGLLRALRSDEKTRLVPVVVLSARAGEEARIEALSVGADDYLMKPIAAKELIARVSTHLELGRLRCAAEAERSQLQSLFEQAPVAIAVLRGPQLIYEMSNPAYQQLVRRYDLIGKALLEVFPEVKDQAIHDILHRVYATGERFVGRELLISLVRPPGTEPEDIYFDLVYDPLRGTDGQVDGIMVLAFDVTDRVRIAQQRERWLAEREVMHAEREQLLLHEQEARTDAERALQGKDEFLAMLGHELRNPLAPIAMTLEILRHRGVVGATREYALIERQVKHLTTLIDDLLDVSAIACGKVELNLERIELAHLVDRALEIAAPLIEQRRHALIVNVPRQGLALDADATRMTQVISNLLTNAAKYTEPGGRIVVEAKISEGEIALEVSDNGMGISEVMLGRVFELFVQERQAIDRASGGLGLGLAIVHKLLALHGGSVTATSPGLGCGSAFTIRLPATSRTTLTTAGQLRTPAYPPLAGGTTASAAAAVIPCRVLVVDDNVDAACTLAQMLDTLGCETRVVHDGYAALALIESFRPQLSLLDIGLPMMSGYELARQMRQLPCTLETRLVAVTGYGQKCDIDLALAAGFDEHVVKPVSIGKLKAVLTSVATEERVGSDQSCV